MELKTLYKFEKAVIMFLNSFDGWELEHSGDSKLCYDAIGKVVQCGTYRLIRFLLS